MGELVDYPSPYAEQRKTAYVGMTIFVAGWGMLFACLFFIYGAMRLSAPEWPPFGLPVLPIALPGVNTAILVASSFTLEWGLRALTGGRPRLFAPMLLVTMFLGALFVVIQVVIGMDIHALGLTVERGPYAASFYGLSGIHAAHILLGLLALVVITVQAFRGVYTAPRHLTVRLWAIYWHFVGVIWIGMYLLLYVI